MISSVFSVLFDVMVQKDSDRTVFNKDDGFLGRILFYELHKLVDFITCETLWFSLSLSFYFKQELLENLHELSFLESLLSIGSLPQVLQQVLQEITDPNKSKLEQHVGDLLENDDGV